MSRAEQKQRLAKRSEGRRDAAVPVIDRPELVGNVNRSVSDVVRQLLRRRSGRIVCVVIDEHVAPLGSSLMETMLPDRLEFIEVLQFGFQRSGTMLRLYTRDFIPLTDEEIGPVTWDVWMGKTAADGLRRTRQ